MMHRDSMLIRGLFLLLCFTCPLQSADKDIPPGLFSEYAGEWKGTFYVHSPEGELLRSMEAHHVYRNVDDWTLEGTQTIRHPDGKMENVTARDYVEEGKVFCRVESDLYGVKILQGKLQNGQIFWWRKDDQTLEVFRERIIDNGKTYAIDGYGIYGKDRNYVYTFYASYTRVK